MLKADAYNHGAIEIARYIENTIDWLGVATLEEGIELRLQGITKPILVSVFSTYDSNNIIRYNLTPLIYNIEQARVLDEYAKRHDRVLGIHIKIDTGMNRIGLKSRAEYKDLCRYIEQSRNLAIGGVCTHYYGSDTISIQEQNNAFENIIGRFQEGIIYHTASSNAIFKEIDYYDMVRIGISAYGYSEDIDTLQPVMHLLSSVISTKEVLKGEVSGYNTFIASQDTRVAIIRGGYYDGITRDMVGCSVIINNTLCKIVAVCMDMTIVDIQDCKVEPEDIVIIQGSMSCHNNNARVLANRLNTIPYEILTRVKGRIDRIYYE